MTRWITREAVAQLLSTHPNTVYKLEKKPDFPRCTRALGNPRWREDEIQRYMEKGRGPSPQADDPLGSAGGQMSGVGSREHGT